ncbi:MAG TPA: nuclear transport factor 2 family protein [Gemmatimonadaceae bacterium]
MQDEQVVTVEQLIAELEAASSRKDVEALVALFAPDATIESYLVSRVFDRKEGVCRGRAEIRELALALMRRGTPWGGHEPPIIRGNTVAIEYHTASSDAERFSVDMIEVRDGKIQSLRAYAGWRAVMALTGEPETDAGASRSDITADQIRRENRRKVALLFEAFNTGDLDAIDELVGPECVGAQGNKGPAVFKVPVMGLRAAFPDIHYTLDDVVAEGDRVAVRWHWTGTHQGAFRGFPATGNTVVNPGAGVFRFAGGKIVAADLETDRLGFLEQIGVVPEGIGLGPRPSASSRP